jgi:hypothetical protein
MTVIVEEIDLFKLAILNDLINLELSSFEIGRLLDPELKSKLRNLKKGTDVAVPKFGEMFKSNKGDEEKFGEISDTIDKAIDKFLKEINDEKKEHL